LPQIRQDHLPGFNTGVRSDAARPSFLGGSGNRRVRIFRRIGFGGSAMRTVPQRNPAFAWRAATNILLMP
jgi:hypothetical protein